MADLSSSLLSPNGSVITDADPEMSYASVSRHIARKQRKQEDLEEEMIRESSGEENVMVCVRVRPFNRRELELQKVSGEPFLRSIVEMPDGMGGRIVCLEKNGDTYTVAEEFHYTKSFWSIPEEQQPYPFAPVTQEDVFQAVGVPIVKYAFAGFNSCVFAYGQTGSGKTHTMMGDFSAKEGQLEGIPGVIPQLCKDLFERVERKLAYPEEGITKSIEVELSAIEIYNEQVRDLFYKFTPGRAKQTVMKVRKHPVEGAFVDQLTVLKPKSWEECLKLIEVGVEERTVAATLMNAESSRSHSVFQITLTHTESVHIRSEDPNERFSKPVTNRRVSKINLVDLAGSERIKKSGAQGANLKEAATINQSLSTLKKVIDALVSNLKEPNPAKHVIVPFRESMLTMLLSHSLGGNSKTTMIACVSPHFDNQEETLLTLRYANRAKGIVNHTRVNEDDAAKKALQLKHQILALQRRIEEGEDEEAEELKDQLEVGRLALRELERENQRLQEEARQMITRSKQEEGARFAAAFYNSMKMAMLRDQKLQLDGNIAELEQRLQQEQDELVELQRELERRGLECEASNRTLLKLKGEQQVHDAIDARQREHASLLASESKKIHEKLNRELELRYAQIIVNTRRLRKQKDARAKELDQLQEEHDIALTAVILQAAEQYEQRVRRFADDDTLVQSRIRKADETIPKCNAQQLAAEREASAIQQTIRQRDREHASRMDKIERVCKERYAAMKRDYEDRIQALGAEQQAQRLQWDNDLDAQLSRLFDEHQKELQELESVLRAKEAEWSTKIAHCCAEEAERMESKISETSAHSNARVAAARETCERKIAEHVGVLRRLETLGEELDSCYQSLQALVAPLIKPFEELENYPMPSNPSPELRDLYERIHHRKGAYSSTLPRPSQHTDPAQVISGRTSGRGMVLPPVEFFPTTPTKRAASSGSSSPAIRSSFVKKSR